VEAVTELATRDSSPPSAGLPRGEFIAWPTGTGEQFVIHRADPRILISGELFEGWHDQGDSAMVTLRCTCEGCPDSIDPALHCPIGDVVTLHGVNRTVIYRIVEYVPSVHGYVAEWPD
jgi:hypothetical protein